MFWSYLVQVTPNDHERNGGLEGGIVVDGTDAADDKQPSGNDYHAADKHRPAPEAIDQRPGTHVAKELDGECCLCDAQRVIDTGKTEVIGQVPRNKVDTNKLLRNVNHADDQGAATVRSLEALHPRSSLACEFLLLADGE